jgi:hypothetical protein
VKSMDWARLNNGLKFLIYRTIFATQENNRATFNLLGLEGGDEDHFHKLYNYEEGLHHAFERAYEAYGVALSSKSGSFKTRDKNIQRKRTLLPSSEAYENRLAELRAEIASLRKGRRTGFRKLAEALEEQIRDLEFERVNQTTPEQSLSPEPRIYEQDTYRDPLKVTEEHFKHLDTLQRPTEYCLSGYDIQNGIQYVRYNSRRWPSKVFRDVVEAMVTYERIQFTWSDLGFAPIYDSGERDEDLVEKYEWDKEPENLIYKVSAGSEDDRKAAQLQQLPKQILRGDVAAGSEDNQSTEYLQQLPKQMAREPEATLLRSSPGSAEHALFQQVRRREDIIQGSNQEEGQKKSDTLNSDRLVNQTVKVPR